MEWYLPMYLSYPNLKKEGSSIIIDGEHPLISKIKINDDIPQFRCNYEFVGVLACVRKAMGLGVMYPYEFYRILCANSIHTQRGKLYVPSSRGPFNLIRNAWTAYAAGDIDDNVIITLPSGGRDVFTVSKLIAYCYVDRLGRNPWRLQDTSEEFLNS